MNKVLQKYSQADNLSKNSDLSTPYTFIEWQARNFGILPGKEFEQYIRYCTDWHRENRIPIDTKYLVKQQYIALLKELSVIFANETNHQLEINFDDDYELESLIPIYARRLKRIAIYLANKRDALKHTKLRYNLVGATQAIEKLFYSYILNAFTKKGRETKSLQTLNFPELSAVKDYFQVSIEELYDDTNYFDKDPTLPAASYFSLNDSATKDYYSQFGINDGLLENLLTSGILSAGNDFFGERQYHVDGGYFIPDQREFSFNIKEHNNWFYWPFSDFPGEFEASTFSPISLSATNFTTLGTAGSSIDLADRIFVRKGSRFEGAWLRHQTSHTENKKMSALLEKDIENVFSFPYPGYGLSGNDIEWTGKSLSNLSKSYELLSNELKLAIRTAYWSEGTPDTTVVPIKLNDSTLAEDGAHAALAYKDADKITIDLDSSIVHSDQQYAWLYKFVTTQIPIKSGVNQILWPIGRIDEFLENQYVPTACGPVAINGLNLFGSTASQTLSTSDIIFKVDAFGANVTEAAWLSGSSSKFYGSPIARKYDTTIQQHFAISVIPGEYTTFLWSDDSTDIEKVFTHQKHLLDCPCIVNSKISNSLERDITNHNISPGIYRWDYCNCASFIHSPCGHSGAHDDYHGTHDFIIEDLDYPSFELSLWAEVDGTRFRQSNKYAWFKTKEEGINFSAGSWQTGTGSPFILRKGRIYRYYRSSIMRNSSEAPKFVKKYAYNNSISPIWIKAIKNNAGDWVSINEKSKMAFSPGEMFIYNHFNSSVKIDDRTTKDGLCNFKIEAPLFGWDYEENMPNGYALGARPFWAKAFDGANNTENKIFSINAPRKVIDEYSVITQPAISDIVLKENTYFKYETSFNSIAWYQPITLTTAIDTKTWYKLDFDLIHDNEEKINLTSTNEISNIVLEPTYDNRPVNINYYAINEFSITQPLIDTTLGIAPTGGIWISPVSGIDVKPSMPYANLSNRHYPTVASVPSLANLYSETEVGGYFTPKSLGVSIFVGKDYTLTWDYDK